jgi:hypothetical protein
MCACVQRKTRTKIHLGGDTIGDAGVEEEACPTRHKEKLSSSCGPLYRYAASAGSVSHGGRHAMYEEALLSCALRLAKVVREFEGGKCQTSECHSPGPLEHGQYGAPIKLFITAAPITKLYAYQADISGKKIA